jgi:hypothetical protein
MRHFCRIFFPAKPFCDRLHSYFRITPSYYVERNYITSGVIVPSFNGVNFPLFYFSTLNLVKENTHEPTNCPCYVDRRVLIKSAVNGGLRLA